jgi:hypothetical protein
VRGSPIRKSSDQRSVDSSPRLIAASYVLHRLLVPRHPPCALNNLATQKTPPRAPGRKLRAGLQKLLHTESEDARVHCAVLNVQPATTHMTPPNPANDGWYEMQGGPDTRTTTTGTTVPGPFPQDPTACLRPTPPHRPRSTHPTPSRRTRRDAVLGAGCSRRPNWSAFHPRAPPRTLRGPPVVANHPGPGAALDHPHQVGGQCSLERR